MQDNFRKVRQHNYKRRPMNFRYIILKSCSHGHSIGTGGLQQPTQAGNLIKAIRLCVQMHIN